MSPHSKTLQLGLIGAGPWGRNFIRAIEELDGVRLARLASGNPESRELVDAGCEISKDWREVAGADDLDGVIVATPPDLHVEMSRMAVAAGIPVLVEKPLALKRSDARKLLELAEARGGFVLVDHIHLFSAAWEAFKREAKTLGPVRSIVSVAGRWGPFREDSPVLWDWGPHDFAMCHDLLGRPPVSIAAERTQARQTEEGLGETLELNVGFGEGVLAGITLSNMLAEKKRFFQANFDTCALVYDDTASDKLVRRPLSGDPGEPLPVPGPAGDEPPMHRLVKEFMKGIRGNSHDLSSLRLGVAVVDILAQAEQALADN